MLKVILKKPRQDREPHLTILYNMLHPELYRYLSFIPTTLEDYKAYWMIKASTQQMHPLSLSWLLYVEGYPVGTCQLSVTDAQDKIPHIGLWIGSNYHRQGLGKQVIHKLEKQAKLLGFTKLHYLVDYRNKPSIGLATRCGYTLAEHIPIKQDTKVDGSDIKLLTYEKVLII